MNLKRIIFAGIFLDCAVAGVTATAALLVTPQACPAPAQAVAYEPPPQIIADDLDMRLTVERSVVVLKDSPLAGERGLFGRIAFNSQTGLPLGWGAESGDCSASE